MSVQRPEQLTVGGRTLRLPIYFPSVSSVKTPMQPEQYLQFLSTLAGSNEQFLVSAFDLAAIENTSSAKKWLMASREKGAIVLMDSGNYESFWKDAQNRWRQEDFHKVLRQFPCDFAFGFDEQNPPADHQEHANLVLRQWHKDQDVAGQCQVIPIIHAAASELPGLCAAVASEGGNTILAVPERRLGEGILDRIQAIKAIRAAMNGLNRYVTLHLLGTGNPISIAMYSAAGADSFDGLEWCQTVVDHDTALLFHLSHADFFSGQTEWGTADLSFQARTLAHNLEFYSDWMRRLRKASFDGSIAEFCKLNLPVRAYGCLAESLGWGEA